MTDYRGEPLGDVLQRYAESSTAPEERSAAARPTAPFTAADSSAFKCSSLSCHQLCWPFQQRVRFDAASDVIIAVWPHLG
ncbi:hypothetical protein ACWCPD_33240 [Streptomyces sp. NPDC001935]